MLRKLFVFHLIPFLLALSLLTLFLFFTSSENFSFKTEIVEGKQVRKEGYIPNLNSSLQDRIDYWANLTDQDQITIYGSSEFTTTPYLPYHFIPDSFHVPTLGVGHAYHQCFSILLELLAFYDELDQNKIVIILSPGWFGIGGTNSQAFVEFARPELLGNVLKSENVPLAYKRWLGDYVDYHAKNLSSIGPEMNALLQLKQHLSSTIRNTIRLNKFYPASKTVQYQVKATAFEKRTCIPDYAGIQRRLQNQFKSVVTNNRLWVNDEYYTKYLIEENGTEKRGKLVPVDLATDREYQDFQLILQLIREKRLNAAFVIQGLNPHYYENIKTYDPLVQTLVDDISKANCAVLNLWDSDTSTYEPGVLKDIMHMGDFGWMKVNEFLVEQFKLASDESDPL